MEAVMPNKVAVGMGIMEFPFSGASAYWRWVDMLEAGGVDSLWQTDRLVSPTPFLECMSVMAALAGRTRRLKFGVNVLSLAMRDAVLVARQCATIDFLSEGRLLPAFGIGSPLGPEWTTLNLDTKTRGRKTDEGLEVIRRLWSEDKVDFEGVHYHLSGAQCLPKPVQPDLPMWIGGSSEAAIRRTAKYGTGWQAGPETPEQAKVVVAAIRKAAAEEGRPIDDDHYGAGIPFRFGSADDPASRRCSRRIASAPGATLRIISRSATRRRSSTRSAPMSTPASRNSSCARPPRATTTSWRRPAG
jgi:alkanesulfonate monooxygenase SsuD/methylene tetrahydromethanopterin reductase-like flavin-dependent oxidoreductase (luciferase family)